MKATSKTNKKQIKKAQTGIVEFFERSRIPLLLLILITTTVYFKSLFLDYTRLDDSIFIVENAQYNADLSNIGISFQRGLFNPTKDAYYRPMFLVDFIIESRFFGTKPAGYHFTNLLFHLLSVTLLYYFLRRIEILGIDSFLLALIFAVHPVLTQAVAWIPGRNDMLLMIFFFSSFILFLRYLEKPGIPILLLQAFFVLVALFTKETAVIIPVIMAGFVFFYKKTQWKKLVKPGISWVLSIVIWYSVRSTATLAKDWISPVAMINAGIERLGVILQYLGKIFLPLNLTVFPEYEDITLIWGILAFVILTGLIIISKSYKKPLTYLGLFWFLIFLLPVLIVPKTLNDQVFEHRLYLPIIGILLMLSEVYPFSGNIEPGKKVILIGVIALVFSVQSIYRSDYFKDPITFWTHAVDGSPHSAYANALLGTKVEDSVRREQLFRRAYELNPDLKNLNYYLGKVLFDKKEIDSAENYLRKEIAHNPIPDAYFLLAQIAFTKNKEDSIAAYLSKVIELDPLHPQANNNLVVLYYSKGEIEKARAVIRSMQAKGMYISPELEKILR